MAVDNYSGVTHLGTMPHEQPCVKHLLATPREIGYRPVMPDSPDDLLRPKEVMAILDVGWDTLTRWASEGQIPYVRVGKGMRRYYRRDVEALLTPHQERSA